jgi:hypothetical protein
MENRDKVRKAFADALIQTLWVKGLINPKEREKITQKTDEKLLKIKC